MFCYVLIVYYYYYYYWFVFLVYFSCSVICIFASEFDCRLDVRVVKMTEMFQSQGVPALLIYRGGNVVGNFVRLGDEFPSDQFHPDHVARFLVEHGFLPDLALVPKIVRSSVAQQPPQNNKAPNKETSRFRVGRLHRRRDDSDDD